MTNGSASLDSASDSLGTMAERRVYAVYRRERDGSATFLSAGPDIWYARHWVLRGEEESKQEHFYAEMKLIQ
jgi:hypothetical protein